MDKNIDVKKYSLMTEMVQALDLLKQRWLQVEYLRRKSIEPKDKIDQIGSMEELMESIKNYTVRLEKLIKPKHIAEWEGADYTVYTDANYHRKYWNEIDLPAPVEKYCEQMTKILGLNFEEGKNRFELSLYDLSNFSIFFSSLEELEKVIEVEDLAPATAFEIEGDKEPYQATELYCF